MSEHAAPAAGRFIGAAVKRREDPRLLSGRGTYVDDVALPGLLHAAFVRSPFARATITEIDLGAAPGQPGVAGVFTGADLAAAEIPTEEVRFVGDPVVMVVADSRAAAEDACELITVDYEPATPVLDHRAAAASGAPEVVGPNVFADDDVEAIFAAAAHVVTETLHQHRYLPVPMETRGVVARWDPHGDGMTVWISTQGAHGAREHFTNALGLPTNRVRVIVKDVGGGFGLKINVGREETAAVLASKLLGRPVKWIEDRWENLVAAAHAREEHATVSVALDDAGTILAFKADHVDDVGAYGGGGLPIVRMMQGPYRVTKVAGSGASVRTNTSTRGAYRGPWMFETVARETILDIAARQVGIDPLELRRRNVIQQADLPFAAGFFGRYEDVTPAETLEQAAEMVGYDEFRRQQSAARAEGRYLGVGIAMFIEPSAMAFGLGASDAVTIRVDPTGTVQVITGLNSQGHSVETTVSQVVAEHLGVDIDDIVFVNGDTALVPVGGTTGGSRNAVFGGGAGRAAALEMRDRILHIAAHTMEASADDLEMTGGVISVRGTPAKSTTLADVAKLAYLTPHQLPPETEAGLEVTSRFTVPGVTWSNATHICTVEVDPVTGLVTVLRYVVSEDCGTIINPLVVEGQIAGGVVQGIGGALLEHFVYDEDGNPRTTTFLDYLLPTATEVPTIEYGHIETPSARPGGFKGMGEGGAIGAPAAVFNAVNDALAPLGVTMTRQPLTPPAIVSAITAAQS